MGDVTPIRVASPACSQTVDKSSASNCQNSTESKRILSDAEWFVDLTYHLSAKEIARDCSSDNSECSAEVVIGWRRGTSEPKLSRFMPFFRKHPELGVDLLKRLGFVVIFNPKAMAAAEQFARALLADVKE